MEQRHTQYQDADAYRGNAVFARAASNEVQLTAAADVDLSDSRGGRPPVSSSAGALSADLRIGGEIAYREAIALRAGLQPSSKDEEPYGRAWDLTLGAGLSFRGMMLDYAFSEHRVFDQTHKVSLGLLL